ncbi:D-alanyl-D-alanine carboxypeptidase/D-alanyl-D-alanine-endopeptidase [Kitasatospora atroaurantiaca]|uniref:D-alanyl-D-alanine carboxypeptidase/D-alanyl-D-alanine-endopeptidase (Penicillin-binding protein 4) n=1 Tax=Kitasatospora atroaurantiaca TaxID=285545 RepID=A0A561EIG8_9ACTN|nr:D-alanyl-D-alanine carboxypeptidase/D-alanyl-D-alanine-endopeptidase [Kitasatospora atroaurantiaca]TWE15415.1 D-alanyl-D-alanine carboxypeptidase/D-alanyl-D-alanine-endopeptidase (penicillin-binding protein 4) [Kitasatospora atroaurantiaca]
MTSRLRRRTLPFAAVAIAASLLAGAAQADTPAPVDPTLAADIDAILSDPRLAGAQAGVQVIDTTTGQVVYQHQADALLTPASTLKTVTSAAALDLLGADHVFTTEVRTTGTRKGSVLSGDLVLRGGGDPSLLPQDLEDLAAKVAAAGITTVTGRVLADGSRYDSTPLGPGWAWDDEPYSYSPQISGLTVATDSEYTMDTVKVTVTPGAAGEAAKVTLFPAEAPVKLSGQITTGAAGSGSSADVTRKRAVNELALSGSLAAGAAPVDFYATVEDPARYTGEVFDGALARHGVKVVRPVKAATGTETSQALLTHDSRPLSELIVPMLKISNNGIAEHLTKEIGKVKGGQGTWGTGVAQVNAFLKANGLDSPAGRQVDGSGLSRYDLITPGKMTALLKLAQDKPWFKSWYEALPVAGNPARLVGGTLAARMRGTAAENNVHAKSGSMSGVDNLSGYATAPDGRRLAFTVMVNNFAGPRPRSVLDSIAVRLAAGPAAAKSLKAPAPRTAERNEAPATRWDDCETLGRC